MIKNPFKKIITVLASLSMFVSLASCGGGDDFVDYAHNGSVKLKLDYTGRDFFVDGIAEVTVKTYIDGDTTHFFNVNGDITRVLKARYFGIDTPESTGAVQEYGKQASKFTRSKLENAMENGTIVVSSPFSVTTSGDPGIYKQPEADSTGSRYLSLVWINETVKHAPVESLSLLNLWIVQDGLSWARIADTEPFADTFYSAERQAKNRGLKIWSGQPDPEFNYGEYQTTTLKEMKDEIVESLNDPDHRNAYDGAKVRFRGVVAGYCDRMLYVSEKYITLKSDGSYVPEDEYDPTHPELYNIEWAGINIFTGTSGIDAAFQDVGAYIEVVGNASDSEEFGFQISGTQGKWIADSKEGEDLCRVILASKDNTDKYEIEVFEYTKAQINTKFTEKDYEALYCRVEITEELTCTDAYVNEAGDALTLTFDGCESEFYAPFLYKGNPDDRADVWMDRDKVIGKSFEVSGVYGYHKNSNDEIKPQVVICNSTDLVCTTPKEGTVPQKECQYNVADAVAHASEAIPEVRYYVNGRIDTLEPVDNTAYDEYVPSKEPITVKEANDIIGNLGPGDSTKDTYVINGTISRVQYPWSEEDEDATYIMSQDVNGVVYKITLFHCKVAEGIDGPSIGSMSKVYVEGRLKKYVKNNSTTYEVTNCEIKAHASDRIRTLTLKLNSDVLYIDNGRLKDTIASKFVEVGSTVELYGVPRVEDGKVYYDNAVIYSAKLHGQHEADPLTVAETLAIGNDLALGKYTDNPYYVIGRVKEIVWAYGEVPTSWHDKDNKYSDTSRMSFIIEDDLENEYLIWGARMGTGITSTDVVVGAKVIATGCIMHNSDGVISTYKNGCQVVSKLIG